jgi:hypothetical protein
MDAAKDLLFAANQNICGFLRKARMRKQNDYGEANQQQPREHHQAPQEDPLNPLTLQHNTAALAVELIRQAQKSLIRTLYRRAMRRDKSSQAVSMARAELMRHALSFVLNKSVQQ